MIKSISHTSCKEKRFKLVKKTFLGEIKEFNFDTLYHYLYIIILLKNLTFIIITLKVIKK